MPPQGDPFPILFSDAVSFSSSCSYSLFWFYYIPFTLRFSLLSERISFAGALVDPGSLSFLSLSLTNFLVLHSFAVVVSGLIVVCSASPLSLVGFFGASVTHSLDLVAHSPH